MPFVEYDLWESDIYKNIRCPDNVQIPVSESAVWRLYPQYRWTQNKMNICAVQNIEHGPHGTFPGKYPIFSKPIYNLYGMGMGCKVISSKAELEDNYTPGHFWMEYIDDEQFSIDLALVNGSIVWHSISKPTLGPKQTFDYWHINSLNNPEIESLFDVSFLRHFSSFSGIINLEILGHNIIEVHLRHSTQFVDFYGKKWLNSTVSLYEKQKWYDSGPTDEGYSIAVFIDEKVEDLEVDMDLISNIESNDQIKRIMACLDEKNRIDYTANPSGGCLIAIINTTDLNTGIKARSEILSNLKLN